MAKLKSKLQSLLTAPVAKIKHTRNFEENKELSNKIKAMFEQPLREFCRKKPEFDYKHGLVYKLLKTDPHRLRNGVLTSHDARYWLRDRQLVVPALWLIRLAGPLKGLVARNELLQWLYERGERRNMMAVYNWTKKWGFEDNEHTRTITTVAKSVADAREKYRTSAVREARSRLILGNKLLKEVANDGDPREVIAFYRSLNKDVITFQIMLGAMLKNRGLLKYCDDIWATAQSQAATGSIVIDEKLRETHAIVSQHANRRRSQESIPISSSDQ